MKKPQGEVKFAYGSFEELPFNAEEVQLFMVPGEPRIYVVPISTIPAVFEKVKLKNQIENL